MKLNPANSALRKTPVRKTAMNVEGVRRRKRVLARRGRETEKEGGGIGGGGEKGRGT